jgi:uncharacterized protein (TIGR00369 family)
MRDLNRKVREAWSAGTLPSPAMGTLGLRILEIGEAQSSLEIETDEKMHNLSGTLHGGIMGDVMDAAMGTALATTLAPNENMATVEMKLSFLRPHVKGRLIAKASIIKRGRRVVFAESTLTDVEGVVIAKASATWLVSPE